jgi:electron transport complex protein RnfB
MPIVYAALSLGIMGLLFGIILAFASKIFAVEVDERIPQVAECLPALIAAAAALRMQRLAGAIVEGKASINAMPGGGSPAPKNRRHHGVAATESENKVAHVMCCGEDGCAHKKCEYVGIDDSLSAMRFCRRDKECAYGCADWVMCSVV